MWWYVTAIQREREFPVDQAYMSLSIRTEVPTLLCIHPCPRVQCTSDEWHIGAPRLQCLPVLPLFHPHISARDGRHSLLLRLRARSSPPGLKKRPGPLKRRGDIKVNGGLWGVQGPPG
ncbi:hypothetical protein FJTKL_00303 [Diaporthe vaccinii]|uniref:Uncharacterized protein n=1 Tax=Diaporthe vaccinii TaxID=105482 RepID=A0ABR4E3K6_9PEZI